MIEIDSLTNYIKTFPRRWYGSQYRILNGIDMTKAKRYLNGKFINQHFIGAEVCNENITSICKEKNP